MQIFNNEIQQYISRFVKLVVAPDKFSPEIQKQREEFKYTNLGDGMFKIHEPIETIVNIDGTADFLYNSPKRQRYKKEYYDYYPDRLAASFMQQTPELLYLFGLQPDKSVVSLSKDVHENERLISEKLGFEGKCTEFNKTILNKFILRWILQKNYDAFSECQNDKNKISEYTFHNMLVPFYESIMPNRMHLVTLDYYDTLHDICKGEFFQVVAAKHLKQNLKQIQKEINLDHDGFLFEILMNEDLSSKLFPGLKEREKYHITIATDLKLIAHFSNLPFGRLLQFASPPSVLHRLKPLLRKDWDDILKIVIGHKILDIGGFAGAEEQNGSKTLTEGYTEKIINFANQLFSAKDMRDIYKAYRGYVNQWKKELGTKTFAETAICQNICSYTNTNFLIPTIKEAFKDLKKENPQIYENLTREMRSIGSKKRPAIYLSYGNVMIRNLLNQLKSEYKLNNWEDYTDLANSDQGRFRDKLRLELKNILLLHGKIYTKVRNRIQKSNKRIKSRSIEVLVKKLVKDIQDSSSFEEFNKRKISINYKSHPITVSSKAIPEE